MADEGGPGVHQGLVQGRHFSPEGGARDRYANAEGGYGGGEVEGKDGVRYDGNGCGYQ